MSWNTPQLTVENVELYASDINLNTDAVESDLILIHVQTSDSLLRLSDVILDTAKIEIYTSDTVLRVSDVRVDTAKLASDTLLIHVQTSDQILGIDNIEIYTSDTVLGVSDIRVDTAKLASDILLMHEQVSDMLTALGSYTTVLTVSTLGASDIAGGYWLSDMKGSALSANLKELILWPESVSADITWKNSDVVSATSPQLPINGVTLSINRAKANTIKLFCTAGANVTMIELG